MGSVLKFPQITVIPSPFRRTRNRDRGIKSAGVLTFKLFSYRIVSFRVALQDISADQPLMIWKAVLLTAMLLGIRSEPQGPGYLPPTGGGGARPVPGGTGHPDEWAGDPANYEFSYEVQDAVAGLDFGHHEMRKDTEATGSYHVLLPDGRTQIVDYVADGAGYRPMVRYDGTATYPAPGPSRGSAGTAPGDEGYRY